MILAVIFYGLMMVMSIRAPEIRDLPGNLFGFMNVVMFIFLFSEYTLKVSGHQVAIHEERGLALLASMAAVFFASLALMIRRFWIVGRLERADLIELKDSGDSGEAGEL